MTLKTNVIDDRQKIFNWLDRQKIWMNVEHIDSTKTYKSLFVIAQNPTQSKLRVQV